MYRRILTQTNQVLELTYNILERKVYADSIVFNNVDGIYFESDVEIADGEADYAQGTVSIRFSFPVTLSTETESIDGVATVLVVRQPTTTESLLRVGIKWKPGELIGRIIGGREKYPTASKVKALHYDATTKRATAYNAQKKTFEKVSVIVFVSLGDGSKIQPNIAHLVPKSRHTFTVVQRGYVLEVQSVSE